jgi:hypothetical protein
MNVGGDRLDEVAYDEARSTRRGVLGRLGAVAAAASGALALPAVGSAAGRLTRVSVNTHGSGFQVEDPSHTYSVVPQGSGLVLKGWKAGSAPTILWVHAAIPILAVLQGSAATKIREVRLSEWRIRFLTSGGDGNQRITNVRIWDGPKLLASTGGLNVHGPSISGGFAKTVALQYYALALSVGLKVPSLLDSGPNTPPPPAFLFISAEATLGIRGL